MRSVLFFVDPSFNRLISLCGPFVLLAQQFQSLSNSVIFFIHYLEILAHIPQVAGHKSLNLIFHQGQRALQFGLIFRSQLLLFGLSQQLVHQALWHFISPIKVGKSGIEPFERLALTVYVAQGGINEDALGGQLSVETSELRRV